MSTSTKTHTYWFTYPEANLENVANTTKPSYKDAIKGIKESIKIDGSTSGFNGVKAIPDIWYIHKTFKMMLETPKDDELMTKFREDIIHEWYAIIVLTTLKEKFGLPSIQEKTLTKADVLNGLGKDTMERNIMDAVWDAQKDESITIYYFEEPDEKKYPIAMTSSSTYIVPTADAWENIYNYFVKDENDDKGKKKIPWLVKEDGRYKVKNIFDNTRFNPEERKKLRDKADDIADGIKTYKELVKELCDTQGPLTIFRNNCTEEGDIENKEIFEEAAILRYIEIDDDIPADENNPRIGGISGECICSDSDKKKIYIVPYPLTEKALEDLINKKVTDYKVEVEEGPTFTVTYNNIKKIFEGDSVEKIEAEAVNVSLLWPRYKMDDWKNYYSYEFQDSTESITYSIVPECIAKSDLKQNAQINNPPADGNRQAEMKKEFRLKERLKNEDEETIELNDEKHSGVIRYQKLQGWPTILSLVSRKGKEGECIGYLRAREIEPQRAKDGDFKASIDFGTSSTIMYCKEENGILRPIDGKNIWSLPLFAPGNEKAKEDGTITDSHRNKIWKEYGFFVPPINKELCTLAPMQSILAAGSKGSAFCGKWAYFKQATEEKSKDVLPQKEFREYSDLKWDDRESDKLGAFLDAITSFLVLEAKACGFSKLNVAVSYPAALSTKEKYIADMKERLKDTCESAKIAFCMDKQNAIEITEITESAAVARKVWKDNPEFTQFCSIDIGGGSSDIFLFRNGEKADWYGHESSLLCGARKILIQCFLDEKKLLEDILRDDSPDDIKALKKSEQRIENQWIKGENISYKDIEYLLSYRFYDENNKNEKVGGEILCRYATSSEALQNDSIRHMRLRVILRIGSIMYYAGMMAQGTGIDPEKLMIYFAGNGSQTLEWICGSKKDEPTKKFLSAMFNAGMHEKKQNYKNFCFSNKPKHEVAEGTLCEKFGPDTSSDEALRTQNTLLVGENIEINQKSKWYQTEDLNEKVFGNNDEYEISGEVLGEFLDEINEYINKNKGNLNLVCEGKSYNGEFDSKKLIGDGTKQRIKQRIYNMGNSGQLESIFMVGIDEVEKVLFR